MLQATVLPGPSPILESVLMFWLEPLQVVSKEEQANVTVGSDHTGHTLGTPLYQKPQESFL